MLDTPFASFHAAFPPSEERVPFDPARHETLAARVPELLAEEWRAFGFGAYGSGLLWTPVPDEHVFDPDDWPSLNGTGIEVLRTAFADLVIWQGGAFHWLRVHSGKVEAFPSDPDVFFHVITEKHFRKSVLLERIFRIANKRLGALAADECFGFAPLPALGGAIAEEHLIKSKMREYVAMAAQVLG